MKYPLLAVCLAVLTGCALPEEAYLAIDDLPNPGRGWTTFYTYNSDRANDRYPGGTISYIRYTWREIEPDDGVVDFGLIDTALERARTEGQTLAFRVMADNAGEHAEALPDWLLESGVGGLRYRESVGVWLFMPDFDDPLFLDYAQRLITALGDRYDGHPDLDHLDIGLVGHWGEWHVSLASSQGATMPSLASARRYIDMHVDAFPSTPLVMLVGGTDAVSVDALTYAVERGAGWRADCWGDYRAGWNHMEDHYPQRIAASLAGEAWKHAPVALETCGVPSDWFLLYPDRIDEILAFAVEYHASILNAKSSRIPAAWVDKLAVFTRQIGYRLTYDAPLLPDTVPVGPATAEGVTVTWRNLGNAPPYRDYVPTLRLTRGESTHSFTAGENPRDWLPGEEQVTTFDVLLPEGSAAGVYEVSMGLTDPDTGEAVIRLDVTATPVELWYPVGEVTAAAP